MGSFQHFEENHFDSLPDDIVLVIIDKLCYIETLIRFSVVCKRFGSLVPKTHSLTIKIVIPISSSSSRFGYIGLLFKNLFNKVFGALFSQSNADLFDHRLSVIKKFQEIKHLQYEFQFPNKTKALLQWVAVFGSHLEAFWFLYAESVSDIDADVDNEANNDEDIDMKPEYLVEFLNLVKLCLRDSCLRRQIAQSLIHNHPTLKSFSAFDSRTLFSMGEEQVARCRSHICENPLEISGPVKVRVSYMPVLELKSCGKIMKKVSTVIVLPSEKIDFDDLSFLDDGTDDGADELSEEAIVEIWDKILNNGRHYEIELPQGIMFSN